MSFVTGSYSPSKRLYTIDESTFSTTPVKNLGRASQAVAYARGRRKGKLTVSRGIVYTFVATSNPTPHSFQDFLNDLRANCFSAVATWDGAFMWAPETTLKAMNELAVEMDVVLNNPLALPQSFTSWGTFSH